MPGCYGETLENGDQAGYLSGGHWYGAAGQSLGEIEIAVGSLFMFRFPHQIPRGATITSATFSVNWGVKDGNAGNSWTATVSAWSHGNSPILVNGASTTITGTTATTSEYAEWPAGGSPEVFTANVASVVQEVVNRTDFVPGGYITFLVYVSAEVGNVNIKFTGARYNLNFTENAAENYRWDVNELQNGSFRDEVNGWFANNPFFGMHTGTGTIAYDGTTQRITSPATGSLKFTNPTFESGKSTGPLTSFTGRDDVSMVFSGWAYIPSTFDGTVQAQFAYVDNSAVTITARDQWIPFCSNPHNPGGSGAGTQWLPWLRISNWTSGESMWLSDVSVWRSQSRQQPWMYMTPDVTRTAFEYLARSAGGIASTKASGQQVRVSRCRKFVPVSGTPRPKPSYTMQASGLMLRTETF